MSIATVVAGVSAAPWYLKFVFGPTVDRFYKHGKKTFIVAGGLLGAISLFVLVFIDPLIFLLPFTFLLFLSHLGIIYLDVSCDGWAIQISKEKERGKINGAMTAGLFIGLTIGIPLLSEIAQVYGYSTSFLACGCIMLIIMIYPLLVKEATILKRRPKMTLLLKKEFKKRTTQLIALFSILTGLSSGLLFYIVPLYMKTILHMDIGQIGLVTTLNPVTMVIGCVTFGILTDRWGRKKVLNIVFAASMISAAFIYANSWQLLGLIYAIIGFFGGGIYAAGNALAMDACNPKIGTTQYSILVSFTNFSEQGLASITGSLVALLGFGRVFLYSAWLCGPALLILYFIRPKKNEVYGADHG